MLLVASGKGGVGTSMVAAMTAISAAGRGQRVLLVDASETSGTLHHLFGAAPTTSLWMLANAGVRAEDAAIDLGDDLSLVGGGISGGAVAPATDADRRAALAQLARLYEKYQLVIFDAGSRLDTITAISELTGASLLLVTSADRLALAANYALVKSVSARQPNASVNVLANRHGEAVAAEACDFLIGACSHFLGRSIDVVGAIPDDPCVQAAVGAGMTVRDAVDGSPAAEAIGGVVSRVLPSWPAPRPAAVASPSPHSRRWS